MYAKALTSFAKILLPFPMPFVSGRKRERTKHDLEFQSRLQLNDRLNGICFFGEVSPREERAKGNETPPEMGAGTAFRQNGKTATGETAEMSYTVTSRELVYQVPNEQ